MVQDVANKPMESVGADLFHFGGKEWLVVVDRYSGFLWVTRLANTHTGAIVKALEDLFVRVGFPARIRSDGGPQFRQEFQQWCSENHISHELSGAYNPRSNGLAEAAVKNAKKLLERCSRTKQPFPRALMDWLNVPRWDGVSPAEAFFGRRFRSRVPLAHVPDKWRPDMHSVTRMANTADTHSRALKPLAPGDSVLVWNANSQQWSDRGCILETRHPRLGSRSFCIQHASGQVTTRNRRDLKPWTSSPSTPATVLGRITPETDKTRRRITPGDG